MTKEIKAIVPSDGTKENELLVKLDSLATDLSKGSLEFGWTANELWQMTIEDWMEYANGKEHKAYTLFINFLQDREAKEAADRKTIAERVRVCRFIPRGLYVQLAAASKYEPTFHQIRACVFTLKDGSPDKAKTDQMINWCISNGWPSVPDIRIQRNVVDGVSKIKVDIVERRRNAFARTAQAILATEPEGSQWWTLAHNVFETWMAHNGVGPAA